MACEEISIKYPWINNGLFERILGQYGNTIKVERFEAQPAFGKGENYSSYLIKVNVEYSNGTIIQHKHFIIKATLGEKLVRSRDVFAKEICIYDEIIPRIERVLRLANISVNLTPEYAP